MNERFHLFFITGFLWFAGAVATATAETAPDFFVTTLADVADDQDGETSLREAIVNANEKPGHDTIEFAPGVEGSIGLTSPLPTITNDIEIRGPGADRLEVRRVSGGNYRIFRIDRGPDDSTSASLSGLTVSNGAAYGSGLEASGGGIHYSGGKSLTLSGIVLCDNQAMFGGGGFFNISADQALVIENTTICRNIAADNYGGGGLYVQGSGAATIRNSTITENNGGTGGAIYALGQFDFFQVLNCTLAGNETGITQVICNFVIRNSILFNGGASELFASLGNLGPEVNEISHSLLRTLPTLPLNGTGNLIGVDPLLGPLQDNGGPTPTLALLPGSPAIDAGDPDFDPGSFAPPLIGDQRDMARLQQGLAATGAPRIDLGAYELIGVPELDPSGESVPDLPIPIDLTQYSGAAVGGGTFSGPGVSGNRFSGAGLAPGEYELTYTLSDGYGGTNQSPFTIEVFDGFLRPDLRSGQSGNATHHRGDDQYGGGQSYRTRTKRRNHTFYFSVQNDGNVPDTLLTNGRGFSNPDFRVQLREQEGGNVTGEFVRDGVLRNLAVGETAGYKVTVGGGTNGSAKWKAKVETNSAVLKVKPDLHTTKIKFQRKKSGITIGKPSGF